MNNFQPHCYSHRMLNPFRGVVNIIEMGNADAVTTDGENWSLYLRDEALLGMSNDGDMTVEIPDIKFGVWNKHSGLKRAPLLSSMDYDAIQYLGHELLAAVIENANNVPYPLHDHYELWLLDKYCDTPLALLHSECYGADINNSIPQRWKPGIICQDSFISHYLDSCEGHHSQCANHALWLAQQVDDSAGHRPCLQWFLRTADGQGEGLSCNGGTSTLQGRILAAEEFPVLLLNNEWVEKRVSCVVEDYFSWQAPLLLLLQNIPDKLREILEHMACKHALRLAQQQHLIPKVIDKQLIRSALVEAVLRKESGELKESSSQELFQADYSY